MTDQVSCWRCGKTLSDPLSVLLNYGPICRAAHGIVESRGWRAVEQLGWWKPDDRDTYLDLVEKVDRCLRWWNGRLLFLGVEEHEENFTAALVVAWELRQADPTQGRVVMGLLWKLVALIRYKLEPTLKILKDADVVQHGWIEAVPELVELMPSIEGILCGLRAVEDAMDLSTVRADDGQKLHGGGTIEPEAGVE